MASEKIPILKNRLVAITPFHMTHCAFDALKVIISLQRDYTGEFSHGTLGLNLCPFKGGSGVTTLNSYIYALPFQYEIVWVLSHRPSSQSSFPVYSPGIACSPIINLQLPGPSTTQPLVAAVLAWQPTSVWISSILSLKLRSAEMSVKFLVNLAFKVVAEYLLTKHIKTL